MKRTSSLIVKVVALCMVFVLAMPFNASAVEISEPTPYASYYLDLYNTYACAVGNGKIEVWYEVMGTGYMDEVGVLSILLYESTDNKNWNHVKTFSHENYSTMLAYNEVWHSSCVSYQGVAGRYYKAYVCIWAGKGGSGDTRYMWTPVEKAT